MKKPLLSFAAASTLALTAPAHAEFTGDTKLACEAILCLSTGQRPNECTPSIQRYFSIKHRKPQDTFNARRNFLNMCPASQQDDNMKSLVNALLSGAGSCDARTINFYNRDHWGRFSHDDERKTTISNQMPRHCATYFNHTYTDFKTTAPRYVGTPETGGYWVEAAQYEAATKAHKAKLEAEKKRKEEERRRGNSWGGGN